MKTIDLSSLLDETVLSVIEDIIEQDEAIIVKAKNGNAVIMPFDDYRSLVESTYISSKQKMVKKIKDGERESIESMPSYSFDVNW